MTVNETLRSDVVRHQIYIQRYTSGVVKDVLKLLSSVDSDIVAQIIAAQESSASPLTLQRLDTMLIGVRTVSNDIYEQAHTLVKDEMKKLAAHESAREATMLNAAGAGQVAPAVIPDATLLYAAVTAKPFQGRFLSEWVADLKEGTIRRLRDAVRMGVVEGQTIDQMVTRVRGHRTLGYKDGILSISRRSAEAMVRTAVSHTVATAREETYKANTDLIKGIQWVSTLDARTSAICQSLDGQVFPVDEGPRPPAHINCRSTTVPVLKSWKELGIDLEDVPPSTRASMNGQVAATETYQTWLEKQPASFQDDVLGPTRGKLFREGGLTLDRFVDENTGHKFTIEDLRRKNQESFAKLFP